MKLYTRTGDEGETSLYGGERRSKADLRVAAYGEVDELQAVIGVVRAQAALEPRLEKISPVLLEIQHDLFLISSELASGRGSKPAKELGSLRVLWLEDTIDLYDRELPVLCNFILQGGSLAGAHLHQARAICRRSERDVVTLEKEEQVPGTCLHYLNRLSDLLFVLARWANQQLDQPEQILK